MKEQQLLGFLMKSLVNHMESRINAELKATGITVTQLGIMEFIYHSADPVQIVDVAEHFDVKHTSVLHVLKKLEEKGFVYRESIPRGHGSLLYLTEEGRAVVERDEDRIGETEEKMMRTLSAEERADLRRMLQEMQKNMDET